MDNRPLIYKGKDFKQIREFIDTPMKEFMKGKLDVSKEDNILQIVEKTKEIIESLDTNAQINLMQRNNLKWFSEEDLKKAVEQHKQRKWYTNKIVRCVNCALETNLIDETNVCYKCSIYLDFGV